MKRILFLYGEGRLRLKFKLNKYVSVHSFPMLDKDVSWKKRHAKEYGREGVRKKKVRFDESPNKNATFWCWTVKIVFTRVPKVKEFFTLSSSGKPRSSSVTSRWIKVVGTR
ncbi:hypothetical protein PPYR_04921 [Photinus pyralis]|uniref:Uncharacterized protein n=1 Tax=Photinus pyralis TaxID=7054 RepID=A0A1Y1LJW4_PHOPY|nr:hypothetical protein PPYR_04921 [Photinus pyralis]